jgi:hypothetical protein
MIVGIKHNINLGGTFPDIPEPSALVSVTIEGDDQGFCYLTPECQASTFLFANVVGGNSGFLTYQWSCLDLSIGFLGAENSPVVTVISPLMPTSSTYTATINVEVTDTLTLDTVSDSFEVTFEALTSPDVVPPPE